MDHYIIYHSEKKMGGPLRSTGRLGFYSSKGSTIRQALGHTVWIITGSPQPGMTVYHLHGRYIADGIEDDEDYGYIIRGHRGNDFIPPIPLNDLEWFPGLRKAMGNFAFGLTRIVDSRFIEALIAVAGSPEDRTAVKRGIDPDTLPNEGGRALATHMRRERNRALARYKKDHVFETTGKLACEICGFDFAEEWGPPHYRLCEVHHLVPIGEREEPSATRLDDLAILCPNCHRFIHHTRPMPMIHSLRLQSNAYRR